MTLSTPIQAIQSLERLYRRGFHDTVTDAALIKIAASQVGRDEAVLRDFERDLGEFEQQYQMSSEAFFQRWSNGQMADTAEFMDWAALCQMAREVRERLELLRGQTIAA
jgi:hypothetical protein